MIIIGGRKCANCGEIKARKLMAKLVIRRSGFCDEWWETYFLCAGDKVCAMKAESLVAAK